VDDLADGVNGFDCIDRDNRRRRSILRWQVSGGAGLILTLLRFAASIGERAIPAALSMVPTISSTTFDLLPARLAGAWP